MQSKINNILINSNTGNKRKILLFTGSYPYSSAAESTFINPEIIYLNSFFEIIIIPKFLRGDKEQLSKDIFIINTFSEFLKCNIRFFPRIKTFFHIILSLIFYKEILKYPKKTFRIYSIKRIVSFLEIALLTKKWVVKFIKSNEIDLTKTIFYTYWLDANTLGICLAKSTFSNIKVISRVHGIDLYEERSPFSYIPFRTATFSNLNKLYSASKAGQKYLSEKYQYYSNKFKVATLSTLDPNFITKQSEDKIFRIVTCSFLASVKRIDLLIHGLKKLGEIRPNNQIYWVHIGNGPLELELKKLSQMILPKNVNYNFIGYLTNKDVINFYKNNPVDVFINISQSEGLPVSIMEAQSCGIPVIASAVGGNKEIVSDINGSLLDKDPTPNDIADAICKFIDNEKMKLDKKSKSRKNWEKHYNSKKRNRLFLMELYKCINSNKI